MDELTLRNEIDAILSIYEGDPEAGHGNEDDLVWGIAMEYAPEPIRVELKRLAAAKRVRWYA